MYTGRRCSQPWTRFTVSPFSLPVGVQGPLQMWWPTQGCDSWCTLGGSSAERKVQAQWPSVWGSKSASPRGLSFVGPEPSREPLWCPRCSVTTVSNSRMFISLSVGCLGDKDRNEPSPASRELSGNWGDGHTKILNQERLWYVLRRVWEEELNFPWRDLRKHCLISVSICSLFEQLGYWRKLCPWVVYGWKYLALSPRSSASHPSHKYTSKVTDSSNSSSVGCVQRPRHSA